LHDLRHSFASDALMSGVPLAVVGELLGHRQVRTTQRYAHLANHVVRQALEIATERIVEAVKPVAALAPAAFEPGTDAQWARIEAMVEGTRGRCGGTRVDLRGVVDGIRWVLHFGAKWREIPPGFGAAGRRRRAGGGSSLKSGPRSQRRWSRRLRRLRVSPPGARAQRS